MSSYPPNVALPIYGAYTQASASAADLEGRLAGLHAANVRAPRFGAVGDGVADDTAAFVAAKAVSNTLYVPSGTYKLAGFDASACRIIGEGRDVVTLTGAGDLLVNIGASTGQSELRDLTIKNTGTRGKLVSVTPGVAIARVLFDNVEFGTAAYHVYANATCVDWLYLNCRFNDANVISRYHDYVTAYREIGCYTWFNAEGLRILRGENVRLDGTYEYNDGYAVNALVSDTSVGLYGLAIHCYFEGNGNVAAIADVNIETTAAARIRNVVFDGATFAVPKGPRSVRFTPGGGGNIQQVGFRNVSCANATALCSSGVTPTLSLVEMIAGGALPSDGIRLDTAVTVVGGGSIVAGASPITFDAASLADGVYTVTAAIQLGGASNNACYSAIWLFQKRTGSTSAWRVILASDAPGDNNGSITVTGNVVTCSWGGNRSAEITVAQWAR